MPQTHQGHDAAPIQERDYDALHESDTSKLTVALIGTETAWFDEKSPVRARLVTYAQGLKALHVVVLTTRAQKYSDIQIGENIFVYATNARSRLTAAWRAPARLRTRADMVSAQDPFDCGFAAWRMSRRMRAVLEVQIHTDLFSKGFLDASLMNRARALVARFVLERATSIRAVSETIRRSLPPVLQQKTIVLPIYTELLQDPKRTAALKERFASFDFRALMVGRLESEKRLPEALEIFAAVQKKIQNICLILVGSGSEAAMLRKRAQELGISGHVFFEGQQTALAPYYAAADLLIHTSRYEGYGLVLVEARRMGLPIISTDVGVAREVGTQVVALSDMVEALYAAALAGPKREAPLRPPYASMREYSSAIRNHWYEVAHPHPSR